MRQRVDLIKRKKTDYSNRRTAQHMSTPLVWNGHQVRDVQHFQENTTCTVISTHTYRTSSLLIGLCAAAKILYLMLPTCLTQMSQFSSWQQLQDLKVILQRLTSVWRRQERCRGIPVVIQGQKANFKRMPIELGLEREIPALHRITTQKFRLGFVACQSSER